MKVLTKPTVAKAFASLEAADLTKLEQILDNNPAQTATEYDLEVPAAHLPATMTPRVKYVHLKLDAAHKKYGIVFNVASNEYYFLETHDVQCYWYHIVNNDDVYIQEYTNTLEIRTALEEAREEKEHGELTPENLAGMMEGGTGVIVDLNQAQTKVEVHLDMTGSAEGKHLSCKANGDVWWTAQGLVPDGNGHLGQYLKHINSGEVWADASAKKVILTSLTLTASSGVYTSDEAFIVDDMHVVVECEMSGTHACFGVDLHRYDVSVSYAVARVNWGGTFYDVLCRIDEENHVVLDLANLTGLTSVVAKYYLYE